jgi:hypothetical protein
MQPFSFGHREQHVSNYSMAYTGDLYFQGRRGKGRADNILPVLVD